MYDVILNIFKEYNVDNLLNLKYLETCDKLSITLLDTVKAGYMHLIQLNINPVETESYKWALQLIIDLEVYKGNDFILSNMLNREIAEETKASIEYLETRYEDIIKDDKDDRMETLRNFVSELKNKVSEMENKNE